MRHLCFIVPILALVWAPPAHAELRAGTARADVTPPVGGQMYGYGARGTNVSTGVHDPLYAKVLVLDDGSTKVAIVTLDLGSFPRENTSNVERLVKDGTDIENIVLVASHTHSSPRFEDNFPSKSNPYPRVAERKIAGAIIEASERLQPARIRVAKGVVKEGHNRRMLKPTGELIMFWENRERIPTWPVDYSVGVILVENSAGDPIATLVNYQTHPVVLGPENLEISADYVGYMTTAVETALGGECMFLQGAAGDINPFWDKTPPEDGGFEQAELMGEHIAEAVLAAAPHAVPLDSSSEISFDRETIALASRRDIAREEPDIQAEISTLLLADELALGFFPGEFFVEHGLRFKEESPFPHTFFAGYTNDALAYFPTIKATMEGGYGAASATRVEVGAGERLVNRALINLLYQAEMIEP